MRNFRWRNKPRDPKTSEAIERYIAEHGVTKCPSAEEIAAAAEAKEARAARQKALGDFLIG